MGIQEHKSNLRKREFYSGKGILDTFINRNYLPKTTEILKAKTAPKPCSPSPWLCDSRVFPGDSGTRVNDRLFSLLCGGGNSSFITFSPFFSLSFWKIFQSIFPSSVKGRPSRNVSLPGEGWKFDASWSSAGYSRNVSGGIILLFSYSNPLKNFYFKKRMYFSLIKI